LHLGDVTKDFGGAPVLSGITLDINAGETVAVMGPSGSGKSTLLHCMSGVLTPTSGQVVFNNAVLSDASDAARSRTRLADFGFVFQDHQLLPELSALDNVALPAMLNGTSRGKARKRGEELLNQLGLGSLVDRRPGQVSGGQAQRIAIARVLLKNPRVLVLDEATSALDTVNERAVQHALDTAAEGRTTIAIAHRLSTIEGADRIFVVDHGQIIESGTHTELLDKDGAYAQLYSQQTN